MGKQKHREGKMSVCNSTLSPWSKLEKTSPVKFLKAQGESEPKACQKQIFFQIYHLLGHIPLSSFSINPVFGVSFWKIGILAAKRVSLLCKSLLQVKDLRLSIWVFALKTDIEKIILASPVLLFTDIIVCHTSSNLYIWGYTVLNCSFLQFPLDHYSIDNET